MLLEFYDYDSSHYLEYETDEIKIDGETIEQRDIRIRQEAFNELNYRLLRNQMIIMSALRNLTANENIQGLLDDNIRPTSELLQEMN